ncbi:hypothetical protein D9M68_69660 [compost metagenome]
MDISAFVPARGTLLTGCLQLAELDSPSIASRLIPSPRAPRRPGLRGSMSGLLLDSSIQCCARDPAEHDGRCRGHHKSYQEKGMRAAAVSP